MPNLGEIAIYPGSAALYVALLMISSEIARIAEKKNDSHYVILLVSVLGVFSGLRAPGVGIDTLNFYQKFYSAQVYGVELGYVWLMRFFASFGSFTLFLLVTEILTYGLIIARFWELRDKASFSVAVFVFLTTYYFLSLNIIRQFLVVAIIFWATRFLFSRRYAMYAAVVVGCVLLHQSAPIALALLAIIPFRLKEETGNRRTVLLCCSLSIPFVALAALVFFSTSPYYASYSRYFDGTYTSSNGSGLLTTAKIILSVFAYVLYSYNNSKEKSNKIKIIGIFFAICSIIGLLGNYLDNVFAYTSRIFLYFAIFEPVFWGWCSRNLKKTERRLVMLLLGVITLYSFYASMAFNGQGVMPYTLSDIPLLI